MTCKVIADKNKPIKILDCETGNVFSLENKEEALKFCDALNVTLNYVNELIDVKVELKKENEQLKQFKEDVFNKIDMHLRMLPIARDNEFNEDDGDPSLYVGAIYMLETLKKELKE